MRAWKYLDRLRLAALLLWALPLLALLLLGLVFLWRSGTVLWWVAGAALCSAAGYGLQLWLLQRDRQFFNGTTTKADVHWSPQGDATWALVEDFAEQVQPTEWPLHDGGRLWLLGRNTLEQVATHYHPQLETPLLELTVPHTLLIIERASRDLRDTITAQIPLSHRLTIGDLVRFWRWKASSERLLNVYRAGRLVLNPASALLSELWGYLRNKAYGQAWTEMQCWLLREYVRKVGYYAIELYSGRLLLTDPTPSAGVVEASTIPVAPLHIVVLGRGNAGKSSLINALFGRLTAATDVLPDTTSGLRHYRLEREGCTAALITDTPGCDSRQFSSQALQQLALEADVLLWVSAAQRADRQVEREQLDALRNLFSAHPQRPAPPLLIVVSHIDQLRPSREWQPPYDVQHPENNQKALHMRGALEAVAQDLAVALESVIPVCLAEGRIYNVEDTLWAALLDQQDAAQRVRLLRCMEQHKSQENWQLLRQQLANAGRWLAHASRKW